MDNEKKLNILGLAIKLIIAIPALILTFIVMTSNVNGDSDKLAIDEFMSNPAFTGSINIAIWSILIALALVLLFFIFLLVTRPKEAIKSIVGIIVTAVIFFILYSVGTTDTVESLHVQGDISVTSGQLDFTHAGIYTTFILLTVASIAAIFMGFIMRFIKN